MKLSELFRDTGVTGPEMEIAGITCDSRRVEPGWAFVCIEGTAADGHRFADKAVQAGATVVVAQRELNLPGVCQLRAQNTRRVWALMCANWFGRPAEKLHMVGVTGTNGKTTTTCMLKGILEACGHKVGLIGTIQNMIGDRVLPAGHTTPDPYDLQSMLAIMVAEGCGYAVMEVSSHALDQDRVEGCIFDVGVFTNLTQDHLDYHKTMENYLAAKKRLFSLCRYGIINADDPWAARLTEDLPCPFDTYSAKDDAADYTAHEIRQRPDGVDFELVGTGIIGRVRLGIPGLFSVYNAMAAAVCALRLGLPFDRVIGALSAVKGVKGRAEIVPTGRDFTVIIDYAHTPDGLENICSTMKACGKGRLVVLFGCGGDRDRGKRPQMGRIAAKWADFMVVTSDNPRTEEPAAIIRDILAGLEGTDTPYVVVENRVEAIHWAIAHAQPGDILLLAGKGHETYQVLKSGVIHLDEREIVAEALATL